MRRVAGALSVVTSLTTAGLVAAVETPSGGSHVYLEAANAPLARTARDLRWGGSRRLGLALGPGTRAVWDPATGVPARIWGAGIPVSGSVASPRIAAAAAHTFLDQHLGLLAPGSTLGDFVMVANDLDAGMRTVAFVQHAGALVVIGGQVSFRFKGDRLFMVASEALPDVSRETFQLGVVEQTARRAALTWIASDVTTAATIVDVRPPAVLPIISRRSVRYHAVFEVVLHTSSPLGEWHVFVDAHDGRPVARQQMVRFATGTFHVNAVDRWPGGSRSDHRAAFTALNVDGVAVVTDEVGTVTWPTAVHASVVATATGDHVTVENAAGPDATHSFVLAPGGSETWDASLDEYEDAQLSTFVHVNRGMAYARGFAPALPLLDGVVETLVNIDSQCNANYGQGRLNFFRASANCSNTGRLADVVYHELGHMLHDNAIIAGAGFMDPALSEGLSDYLAVTITGDSGMGRGFYKTDAPLREVDPVGTEHVWPDDIGEEHFTGLVIAGALWDLRALLVAEHGAEVGVGIADELAYQAERRAVDIPTMYFEVLAADDDDGNLANGTPHVCAIDEAFGRHGLRRVEASVSELGTQPPARDGYEVSIALTGLTSCRGDAALSAVLHWRDRSDHDVGGTVDLAPVGGDVFAGEIPAQLDGTVVQYRLELLHGDGYEVRYPANPAAPFYEMFVGHVEPIYCTDFELDPAGEAWSFGGATSEDADDWQWGVPLGVAGSRDPDTAHSGTRVLGNDLADDGKYATDTTNFATSPSVVASTDGASPFEAVRLQYRRWLSVEDGYYDQAIIYANGVKRWGNFSTGNASGARHHVDEEWRFHDVDLTPALNAGGAVDVTFELNTDGGLELGGWTLDDVCIVGWIPTVCGDGITTGLEACDDGEAASDTAPDACRTTCELPRCGDGVVDSAEQCDDGNGVSGDGCEPTCALSEGAPIQPPPMGSTPRPPEHAARPLVLGNGACSCRHARPPTFPRLGWLLAMMGARLARQRAGNGQRKKPTSRPNLRK